MEFTMYSKLLNRHKLRIYEQAAIRQERYLNPLQINLPPGYTIEVFAQGLDAPSCIDFDDNGDLFVGESGFISGKPAVLRLGESGFEMFADGFLAPLSGICCYDGMLYVSHLGKITTVNQEGVKRDIISGLPSYGDHWNSNITFGDDGKMYFGQGTATNSGVVGIDNYWVHEKPYFCDHPGSYIMLNGQNFETNNILLAEEEKIYTGAFSPYGVQNLQYEIRKGITKASGSILRANPNGTELELVAWGFRFLTCVRFDRNNRLFAANQSYDVRGSRPIANAPDEFHLVNPNVWYGWPDYAGGDPVTEERFKPEGGDQPEFLLTSNQNVPPRPYVTFPVDSYITGFDFNYNSDFGPYGDAYIAEFGMGGRIPDQGVTPFGGKGHRISRIDMRSGGVTTFAINKSGFSSSITREGGLSRPVDVKFGPDGAMYVVDMGINAIDNFSYYYPNTGVIWKITKVEQE
jgi:glucose/arabinose dehydrogenase